MEKRLSRRDVEFYNRRRWITETALRLFSEKGFQNVTMNEIAEQSEFAVATLYKYFPNKEELYRAIILEKTQEFYETLTQALKAVRGEIEGIKKFIETRIQFFDQNRKFVGLYVAEARGPNWNISPGLNKDLKKDWERILSVLARFFENGIKKGLFREYDPYLLAIGLDCMVLGFLFLEIDVPGRYEFDSDLIMKIFLEPVLKDGNQDIDSLENTDN